MGFATKAALAQQMLARALTAGVPARWVVADCLYGRVHHLRRWLEAQGQAHVLGIMPGQVVAQDGQSQRARALVAHARSLRFSGS